MGTWCVVLFVALRAEELFACAEAFSPVCCLPWLARCVALLQSFTHYYLGF